MAKAIGPTFYAELVAARVTDWRFSWTADGTLTFAPDCASVAAVEAVYAAHDPTKALPIVPTPIDARLWLERLSDAKQLAVTTAAAASPPLLLWLLKAAGAQNGIVLTDPETIAGVAALVTAGVLTTDDQTVLLAP